MKRTAVGEISFPNGCFLFQLLQLLKQLLTGFHLILIYAFSDDNITYFFCLLPLFFCLSIFSVFIVIIAYLSVKLRCPRVGQLALKLPLKKRKRFLPANKRLFITSKLTVLLCKLNI